MGYRKGRSTIGLFGRISVGYYVVLILFGISLFGCQNPPTASPAVSRISPTTTHSPTKGTLETATPSSQATSTDTVTPEPGPSMLLTRTHPEFTYVSPITVQHVTQSSVICSFEFNKAAEGYLFYWPSDVGMQERNWVAFDKDRTQHVVRIDDLVPGVEYEIAVGLLDDSGAYLTPVFLETIWDPIRVRTLRQEIWPLLVGVLGDSGFGDSITYELAEHMATYDLDFVLHTGDIVYNVYKNASVQEAFALKYFDSLSPILKRYPLYPVPGNHEYYEDAFFEDQPYYFHVFPPYSNTELVDAEDAEVRMWYAIDLEPLQILMLDTQLFYRGTGRTDQTTWVMERLMDERFKITIPVFHVPPYTSGRHMNDGRFIQTDWVPLFEEGRVPLVLSGHDHNYQRLSVNDITYVVSGGGSSILYPIRIPLPQSKYFAVQTHFVLLEIHIDRIVLSAITPKGELLDQITLEYSN